MMLSQPMHQYAPNPHFQPLSSNADMPPASQMSHQHQPLQQSHSKQKPRHAHHPYQDLPDQATRLDREQMMAQGAPGPIRRRISRACDQCNQLRTKCDGKLPCQHCVGQ